MDPRQGAEAAARLRNLAAKSGASSHSASSSPRLAPPPALKASVSVGSVPAASAIAESLENMRITATTTATTTTTTDTRTTTTTLQPPGGAVKPGKPVLHPRGSRSSLPSLSLDFGGHVAASDVPSTVKLLSELERSWAMFAASWKVVDLFAGMQIWQEQPATGESSEGVTTGAASSPEPLNNMLLSTLSAGLVTFLAGAIGGGGFVVAGLLTTLVVVGTLWTLSNARAKQEVPCFKTLQAVDGSPSEIFLYLMGVANYPVWDASVEKVEVVHTIDDHADIIHVVYRPCPPTHGSVRATCKGGGFIISPRTLGVTPTDELTSMVTNVVHLDPQGWEGRLLRRLNSMHTYLRPQILALTGLHEVMEARKYVCPNVPEEFSAALAASTEEQANAAAGQDRYAAAGATGGAAAPASTLQDFPSNVPRAMWAEPDGAAVMVRGPDYLTDRRKIPSQAPAFRLMGVDLFESSEAVEHIASRPDNAVQRELKRHAEQGTEMPFTFVINFVVPGNPRINMVLYYQAPHPSVLADGSPFAELMADFLEGSDEFRNERFKLIPCIVEGSFIVRQAVGSTPALIGKKLRQPYFRGTQYFELDVDIGSSAVANRVVGLVSGYTKKLVIDMGFVLEGQSPDELPERLMGSVRLVHIDLGVATKLT
ncbi:hypothetical protein BBJ28_00011537 [Nothophytophthora sp. Chile5]|nr:hypothetical protein BBJ28_00011537 [Nothophytophthora sp. Chile5]